MSLGKEVIINGGDVYVTEYRERYGTAKDIMTGVNQESVWSGIDLIREPFMSRIRTIEIISANMWNRVRQTVQKCICWNIQQTVS